MRKYLLLLPIIFIIHDMEEIVATLDSLPLESGKPTCIVAHTTKAKGVSEIDTSEVEEKIKEAAKERRLAIEKQAALDAAASVKEKTVKISGAAGNNGKLFGSITAAEVSAELKKQFGLEVDKRKISLEGDIKSFGTFNAEVKFGYGISAPIYVLVSE